MSLSLDSCYDLSIENKRELVHPATDANAAEVVEALKAGKVIAVPTDTLYGFACDAWYSYILISSLGDPSDRYLIGIVLTGLLMYNMLSLAQM
ncbi:hypothetical protein RIF29_19788 [Crotalaria pallida]|uniref:Threonylcarbamoyl-AMP synthase n=1 Tax=Crotalaria pallida TaxID=3830 RepID=A0AAN9F1W0_CROPI